MADLLLGHNVNSLFDQEELHQQLARVGVCPPFDDAGLHAKENMAFLVGALPHNLGEVRLLANYLDHPPGEVLHVNGALAVRHHLQLRRGAETHEGIEGLELLPHPLHVEAVLHQADGRDGVRGALPVFRHFQLPV